MKKVLTISVCAINLLISASPIHDLMDNRIKGKSYTCTLDDNLAAEDGGGIGILEGISNLHTQESEAQIPDLPKR